MHVSNFDSFLSVSYMIYNLMAWHFASCSSSIYYLAWFGYIWHTRADWPRKTDFLWHVAVPNTFPMRNRSPCPFSGPQWPRVAFIRDGLHVFFRNCIAHFPTFSFLIFLVFLAFNRLGGDSFLLSLFSLPFFPMFSCRVSILGFTHSSVTLMSVSAR